jgi:uncharacterized protein YrrD
MSILRHQLKSWNKEKNMIKGNDVIGLNVISMDNGKELARVEDIIYDPRESKVKALLIDNGGWFSSAKVILLEDVRSIGQDAVVIDSEKMVKKASDVKERVANIAKQDNFLTQTNIVTEGGNKLGKVSDIYFDPKSGVVKELEVSQGLKNIQSGKKTVRVDQIMTVGEDATIVKEAAEDQMEKQAQERGLQGQVNEMRDKTKDYSQNTQDKAPELMDVLKEKAQQFKEGVQEKAEEVKENPKTQEFTGKVKEASHDTKENIQQRTEKAPNPNPNPAPKPVQQPLPTPVPIKTTQVTETSQFVGTVPKPTYAPEKNRVYAHSVKTKTVSPAPVSEEDKNK